MTTHYIVRADNPYAHLISIEMQVSVTDQSVLSLWQPVWIPGSYLVRDFNKNIIGLSAIDEQGNSLAIDQSRKNQWQVNCSTAKKVVVSYQIYAWDLSIRSAHFDQFHCFFNGTSAFMAVAGREAEPVTVELAKPNHACADHWEVATTMPRNGANKWGFGQYRADNFDALIDYPVEYATFSKSSFTVHGIEHDIVVSGIHDCDMERLAKDLAPICQLQIDTFGDAPFDQYLFMTQATDNQYGGLEHRDSTALICPREELPSAGEKDISDNYLNYLTLCSHEYFHSWNVKRIKPASFHPYDLDQESYTRQLWWFEGITSYYELLFVSRAGLIDQQQALDYLAKKLTRVTRMPGRHQQTVEESSFNAWTKFYQQDENAPNAIISYYTKGYFIAFALDAAIRQRTNHKQSLDHLLVALWENYGKPHIGVPEGAIELLAKQVIDCDLTDIFEQGLRQTDDLPLAPLLAGIGAKLSQRPATSFTDWGGKGDEQPKRWLGANIASDPLGAKLTHVLTNSPAMQAGLSTGDVIVAADGLKVNNTTLIKRLQRHEAPVHVIAFRRDVLIEADVPFALAPIDTCLLSADDSDLVKTWLGV